MDNSLRIAQNIFHKAPRWKNSRRYRYYHKRQNKAPQYRNYKENYLQTTNIKIKDYPEQSQLHLSTAHLNTESRILYSTRKQIYCGWRFQRKTHLLRIQTTQHENKKTKNLNY